MMLHFISKNLSQYVLVSLLALGTSLATAMMVSASSDLEAAWAGLLGKYEAPEGQYFYVREDSGRLELLFALDEAVSEEMCYFNQQFFAVIPLESGEQDTFRLPADNALDAATVEFTRDAQGFGDSAMVGTQRYERQFYAPEKGETFRIPLVRPVDELRPLALAANPPEESGAFLSPDLVEVDSLDQTIHLDVRYATDDNFMGAAFYAEPRAFLQRPAAEALVRVNQALRQFGYGLVAHDAYRPWYVTWMFWEATPEEMRNFVADPQKGSRHNRGGAVDVSMYELATGKTVDFGGGYDEFSERSFIDYPGGSSFQRWRRELLAFYMVKEGFSRNPDEWWHFDFSDWQHYPILNETFDKLQ